MPSGLYLLLPLSLHLSESLQITIENVLRICHLCAAISRQLNKRI